MLNKTISTPLVIGMTLIVSIIVGGVIYWQYDSIPEENFEIELPEKEERAEKKKITNFEECVNEAYSLIEKEGSVFQCETSEGSKFRKETDAESQILSMEFDPPLLMKTSELEGQIMKAYGYEEGTKITLKGKNLYKVKFCFVPGAQGDEYGCTEGEMREENGIIISEFILKDSWDCAVRRGFVYAAAFNKNGEVLDIIYCRQ